MWLTVLPYLALDSVECLDKLVEINLAVAVGVKLVHEVIDEGAAVARDSTGRPHAPSGVAAFMSAHSKTPHVTPSMGFPSGKGVEWGRRAKQLGFTLSSPCSWMHR